MIYYENEIKKCPSCRKNTKFCVADMKDVKRIYCPICLKDIEVTFKGKEA